MHYDGAENRFDELRERIDAMKAAEPSERPAAARLVLDCDRENIDALVTLANHSETLAECLALLREAIRVGRLQWARGLQEVERVAWWRNRETRPFMNALATYGRALADIGYPDQAASCFDALLKMDPADHLGVEERLLGLTAARNDAAPTPTDRQSMR